MTRTESSIRTPTSIRHGRGRGFLPATLLGMSKKYREVRRILRQNGWVHVRSAGSHEIWKFGDGQVIAVPSGGQSNRDVPAGTLANIRRATGIKELR